MSKQMKKIIISFAIAAITTSLLCYSALALQGGNNFWGRRDSNMLGDVDGDSNITMKDVVRLQWSFVKLISLNDNEMARSEVSGDLFVTMHDMIFIQKYIAELIDVFPAQPMYSDSEAPTDIFTPSDSDDTSDSFSSKIPDSETSSGTSSEVTTETESDTADSETSSGSSSEPPTDTESDADDSETSSGSSSEPPADTESDSTESDSEDNSITVGQDGYLTGFF